MQPSIYHQYCPLHHLPKYDIYPFLKHCQGQQLHHFPAAPPKRSFSKCSFSWSKCSSTKLASCTGKLGINEKGKVSEWIKLEKKQILFFKYVSFFFFFFKVTYSLFECWLTRLRTWGWECSLRFMLKGWPLAKCIPSIRRANCCCHLPLSAEEVNRVKQRANYSKAEAAGCSAHSIINFYGSLRYRIDDGLNS